MFFLAIPAAATCGFLAVSINKTIVVPLIEMRRQAVVEDLSTASWLAAVANITIDTASVARGRRYMDFWTSRLSEEELRAVLTPEQLSSFNDRRAKAPVLDVMLPDVPEELGGPFGILKVTSGEHQFLTHGVLERTPTGRTWRNWGKPHVSEVLAFILVSQGERRKS